MHLSTLMGLNSCSNTTHRKLTRSHRLNTWNLYCHFVKKKTSIIPAQ